MKYETRPSAWQDDGHEEFFLLLWGQQSEDELEEATNQGREKKVTKSKSKLFHGTVFKNYRGSKYLLTVSHLKRFGTR